MTNTSTIETLSYIPSLYKYTEGTTYKYINIIRYRATRGASLLMIPLLGATLEKYPDMGCKIPFRDRHKGALTGAHL